MDVNSISSAGSAYAAYEAGSAGKTSAQKTASAEKNADTAAAKAADTGVIYEKSDAAQTAAKEAAAKKTYSPNMDAVQKMKSDVEARNKSFVEMIQKMFNQQAKTSNIADDLWKKLASGDFTVDAATKAQAQKDIGEDGYWGVNQTSSRILDFAKALTGGDPDKIDKMKEAFEKGYKQAEKTWGGKLPDISQKTYDAVLKGFDDWKKEAQGTEEIA